MTMPGQLWNGREAVLALPSARLPRRTLRPDSQAFWRRTDGVGYMRGIREKRPSVGGSQGAARGRLDRDCFLGPETVQ